MQENRRMVAADDNKVVVNLTKFAEMTSNKVTSFHNEIKKLNAKLYNYQSELREFKQGSRRALDHENLISTCEDDMKIVDKAITDL